jgi:hypothetical protein
MNPPVDTRGEQMASTTIPTQSDDLRVVTTPPTAADAQLLVQLSIASSASGADRGWDVLATFDTPPTLGQLRKRCPVDSEEYSRVMRFLESCETMATFVKHGLLNEGLVNDLFWVTGAWKRVEKITKGLRKENGEPRLGENFEWLAGRAT